MKGLNHADERYCRLYTRDTAAWKLLPWQSKGLYALIERKLDRSGVCDLGDDVTPAEAVAALTDQPLEYVEPGLKGLLDKKWLELHGSLLIDPDYVPANEAKATDRLRQEASRERRKSASQESTAPLPIVTQRDHESQDVTESHERSQLSRSVTPCRAVPIQSVPNQSNLQQQPSLEIVARGPVEAPGAAPQLRLPNGLLDPDAVRRAGLHVLLRMRHVVGDGWFDHNSFRDALDRLAVKPPEDLERALRTYESDPWVLTNRHKATPEHLLKRFESYVQGNPRASPRGSVRAQRAEEMEAVNELGIT